MCGERVGNRRVLVVRVSVIGAKSEVRQGAKKRF